MKLRHWFIAGVSALAVSGFAVAAPLKESATAVPNPPPLAHIGAFARGVSYAFQYTPAEMVWGQHPLAPNSTISGAWIYSRLITDSGKIYVLMRIIDDTKTSGATLQADGKPDARVTRTAEENINRSVDPTSGLIFSGTGFNIKLSPSAVSWSDANGAINISGSDSPLGKVGTAEFVPYIQKDGTSGIDEYTGQYQPVTGTVMGEHVKGMFVIDHFIGTEKFGGSALSNNESVWFKFANVFEDGSVEVGEAFQLAAGDHGAGTVPAMHGGVVSDGAKVTANSDNPQFKFVLNKDGTVKSETVQIGKDQYIYKNDQFGGHAIGKSGLQQAYGGVVKVGDKRKIVNQFAIAEYNLTRLAPDQIVQSK